MKHYPGLIFLLILFTLSSCSIRVDELGAPVKSQTLANGIFRGEYKKGPVTVILDVHIKDQKIEQIDIIKHDCWKGKKAVPDVPNAIIETQSTQVDAVSGATVSSQVIMNAAQMALNKASVE